MFLPCALPELQQASDMDEKQSRSNDPLHGVRMDTMLEKLVEEYGWDELADRIRIRCFANNPSIKSSLTFLRKTGWAKDKVEKLYLSTFHR